MGVKKTSNCTIDGEEIRGPLLLRHTESTTRNIY